MSETTARTRLSPATPAPTGRTRRPRHGSHPDQGGPNRIIDRMLADGVDLADVDAVRDWLDALIQQTPRALPADQPPARRSPPRPTTD